MTRLTKTLVVLLCGSSITRATLAAESPTFDLQAHRGGLGLMTESTLAGFANALELGVSTLELDIQITRDGQAVVTHDRQIQTHKCADTGPVAAGDSQYPYVGKYIRDLTFAQLGTLDCGFQQLPGYPQQQVVAGATMPLLSEVFALLNDFDAESVTLNIETKVEAGAPHETAPRSRFVDITLAEIRKAGKEDRVTLQSFDWGILMAFAERAPDIPLVALTNGQSFLQCGQPGRSPWLGGLDMDDFDCDVVRAVDSIGVAALSPVHGAPQDGGINDPGYVPFVTPEMVGEAHARGLRIIPWTVDDRATMAHLLDMGVDGLITNYPDRLRELLAERGLELPPQFARK